MQRNSNQNLFLVVVRKDIQNKSMVPDATKKRTQVRKDTGREKKTGPEKRQRQPCCGPCPGAHTFGGRSRPIATEIICRASGSTQVKRPPSATRLTAIQVVM